MSAVLSGAVRVVVLAVLVLAAGLVNIVLGLPVPWGLLLPLVVLVVGWWWLLGGMKLNASHFTAAVLIAILACVVSAFIGALGATVGGKPFAAALVDPGIGWLAGDTVSAILGLALLPLYTARLVRAGIAKLS
jgi:hypothetical protein